MRKIFLLLITCNLIAANRLLAQRKLTIDASKSIATVQPTMWGVFFEDINFAADGGLYAELVKNRSFEFPLPMMGWKMNRDKYERGAIVITNKMNGDVNSKFATVTLNKAEGNLSLSNEGFRGMGFHSGKQYDFSILAKSSYSAAVKLKIQLVNSTGKVIGSTVIDKFTNMWKNYSVAITTTDSAQKGKLNIVFEGEGAIDIDVVSLFPHDTWKGRSGGLRNDIAQLIADLKPGFIRFPGGCIVEGRDIMNRYQWKTTVGKVNERQLIMNRWNVEFRHRSAPDYYQSFGLGFYEYFQFAEDCGAEPLPILNCGMACQFNSGEVVAMEELKPYVDDALDLIEFANGCVQTPWGKLRSDMGHPEPFNLKMIGVGNEQWEPQYFERYKVFEKAILAKYPDIKLVSGTGPSPDGTYFDYAWKELKKLQPAFVDEHYYKPPSWFYDNVNRYDKYDRNGAKIFAGEYAAHIKGNPADGEGMNVWESALAEAAFMTGLERNADLVQMASYAPLLAHTDAWQWRPDLIWFDNLKVMATPNYFVQKMFSNNKGTDVVQITENGKPVASDSLYSSAVVDKQTNMLIIKMVNSSRVPQTVELNLQGLKLAKGDASLHQITTDNLSAFNKLSELDKVKPGEKAFPVKTNKFDHFLPSYSFTVFKIPLKTK
jgi:alpha-L-arabinofuranosidase